MGQLWASSGRDARVPPRYVCNTAANSHQEVWPAYVVRRPKGVSRMQRMADQAPAADLAWRMPSTRAPPVSRGQDRLPSAKPSPLSLCLLDGTSSCCRCWVCCCACRVQNSQWFIICAGPCSNCRGCVHVNCVSIDEICRSPSQQQAAKGGAAISPSSFVQLRQQRDPLHDDGGGHTRTPAA